MNKINKQNNWETSNLLICLSSWHSVLYKIFIPVLPLADCALVLHDIMLTISNVIKLR